VSEQVMTTTEARRNFKRALAMLANGPVIITRRGKRIAVLVSIQEWNLRAELLEKLRKEKANAIHSNQ